MIRIFTSAALLLALVAVPAAAQRVGDVPRRPSLPAAADTNNARAYLDFGNERVRDRPRDAADAFYWAYQLDPTSADALYGRYVALLMSNPRRLVSYWEGDRRTLRNAEVIAIDSLFYRALTMDPFLDMRHDAHVFRMYLHTWARQQVDRSGGMGVTETEVQRWVSQYLLRAGPYTRARDAHSRGRYEEAARLYEDAIRAARRKSFVRTQRARVLVQLRNLPEALREMGQAVGDLRREDQRELVYLYESKALLEQGIGVLYERMGDLPAAREAYGRALMEDLTYHPAHVRMATLSLVAGDTAAALAELDLAAQATSEPSVTYLYGAMLSEAGRYDDAAAQLRRAMEAAPHWAEPRLALAMVYDAQQSPEALALYREFLDRATATHSRRSHAEARVSALAVAGAP